MSHVLPGTNRGAKKGNPWIWSQCVWVIMRCPSQRGPADNSAWPNPCAPVPQSRTISVSSSPRTSTHDVLPPWRSVVRPGLAKDPRVPQNRISILVPSRPQGCCTALHIKPHRGELFVQNINFLCRRSEAAGRQIKLFGDDRPCAPSVLRARLSTEQEWHEADIPFTMIDVRFWG